MKTLRHFYMMFVGFVAFGLIGEAHASWYYLKTPEFMSDKYPNAYPCTPGDGYNGKVTVDCSLSDMPDTITVITKSDYGVRSKKITTFDNVHCLDGICATTQEKVYSGMFSVPDGMRRNIRLRYIPLTIGYYIHRHPENNHIWAWRYGTGPLAEEFPIPYIEHDQGAYYLNVANYQDTVSTSGHQTYDLWCDPRGDLCSFTDDEGVEYKLSREYLPQHIPLAEDTSDCLQEVCYDDNMDVIGLNPDYHLFD